MTAETHLFRTYAFWFSVLIPPFIASVLVGLAVWEANLKWDPSPQGFRFFYDHFKLQMAIASLSIPLGALIATHHRSMQTAQQIRTQQKEIANQKAKDAIRLHADHKNQFVNFMERASPFGTHGVLNAWELYETLYPTTLAENLEVSDQVKDVLLDLKLEMQIKLSELQEEQEGKIEPRNQIERASSGMDALKTIEKILDIRQIPDLTSATPALTEKCQWVTEMAAGLIRCANFQKQCVNRSLLTALERLNYDIHTVEEELQLREATAHKIELAILEANEMDYEVLHEETKDKIRDVVSQELNQLMHDSDVEHLKIIIEHHLRSHNDKALMESYLGELLDYFDNLY